MFSWYNQGKKGYVHQQIVIYYHVRIRRVMNNIKLPEGYNKFLYKRLLFSITKFAIVWNSAMYINFIRVQCSWKYNAFSILYNL